MAFEKNGAITDATPPEQAGAVTPGGQPPHDKHASDDVRHDHASTRAAQAVAGGAAPKRND